jgi:hypothetical protein
MTSKASASAAVPQLGDRFVTAAEAADFLGTTVHTLNYWRALGRGPRFYRHGRRSVRYLLSDLREWGTANCVQPERVGA